MKLPLLSKNYIINLDFATASMTPGLEHDMTGI
jgi:hypothetical protein